MKISYSGSPTPAVESDNSLEDNNLSKLELQFAASPAQITDLASGADSPWYCQKAVEKWLLLSVDILAWFLAFALSRLFLQLPLVDSSAAESTSSQDVAATLTYVAVALGGLTTFWGKGHYSKRRPYWSEVRELLQFGAVLALLHVAIIFVMDLPSTRSEIILNWVLVPPCLLLLRTCLKLCLLRAGGWARPMVIVGCGVNARETALAFEGEKLMGYSLIAFLVPNCISANGPEFHSRDGRKIPYFPLNKTPQKTLEALNDPHVVLALEQGGIEMHQELIQNLGRQNHNIQIVPSIRGLPLYGMEMSHFFAHEVLILTVRNNLARRLPQFIKRLFDIVVSASVLIVLSPVFLWIAAGVRSSGGAVFYGHRRQGQHNRPFACYKFRTMAPNAEQLLKELLLSSPEARAEWERDFKLKDDPRVTKLGKFLRSSSLDELPQLWNVLKGEMSLVGPRPVVEAELERYGNQVDYYFEAKPGITGLWQISGRNDITYETRVYLDAWYVKNWSFFTDVVILLRTIKVILKKDGAY